MSEKPKPLIEHLVGDDPESIAHFAEEVFILECTEAICEEMHEAKVTRKQLGEMMGLNAEEVDDFLNGETQLTVRTVARVLVMLGKCPKLNILPKENLFPQPGD